MQHNFEPSSSVRTRVALLFAAVLLSFVPPTGMAQGNPEPATMAAPETVWNLKFQLKQGSTVVGHRDVKIRNMAVIKPGDPEVRIMESWTEVKLPIAGRTVSARQRATARTSRGRTQFTAVTDEDGRMREVQGKRLEDGRWSLSVVEGGKVAGQELRPGLVQLSTLDLLDPDARLRLLDRPTARLLLVETGEIMEGRVENLGEGSLQIGGTEVLVERIALHAPAGRLLLQWNLEGVLVAYELTVLGQKLEATVSEAPKARSWGTVEAPTRFGRGAEVGESEL